MQLRMLSNLEEAPLFLQVLLNCGGLLRALLII